MASSEVPELLEIVAYTDEQFYLETAEHVLNDVFGSTPYSKPHKIEIAKRWLTTLAKEHKNMICGSSKLMAIVATETDIEIIGKAVLDGLLSHLSPVPATFLAAHILRVGLRYYCSK